MGPPGEMKLPGGPMIVIVSINCSTVNTAAAIPNHRGNRSSLAAKRIGAATMMLAMVSMGADIATMSPTVRAVAEPS
ncbi:hypothetical protein A5633_02795 [Mycolicibacterium elephantis]|uniref:Uncharacterized protein n=1 Tax=Mycolicibacterium elephantis DSM 44368 TaxID=1335622 RepID=A0A439E0X0_9MYCO|nr:hypothetical protein AAV95_23655 [Mycolicibacterium elephantis]OBA66154.1 hypothetical protein A5633_02795 [Mycolicibacterium elephantis]OBE93276.1 hypothetical protein A5776_07380 [Mycolicibacterium elephantis]RWA24062.1 hypothetical protein MELE44368_02290 [Mycolicibacterium elephantis DSM 44368]